MPKWIKYNTDIQLQYSKVPKNVHIRLTTIKAILFLRSFEAIKGFYKLKKVRLLGTLEQ